MRSDNNYQHMHKLIENAMQKLPLRELARKMDISPPSLHNYVMMGTEPRISALRKIAKYFGVTVAELMGEIDELDGRILTLTRKMNKTQKQELLKELRK